jgi:hypothetical protein
MRTRAVSSACPTRRYYEWRQELIESLSPTIEKTMPGQFARFRETKSSPGLIIVSQDLDIGAAIDELLLIWVATDAEEWADHIGFVPV